MSSSDSTTNAEALRMPRRSGHVYKKSGVVRSWKLLFFSLEGSVLYYFKREGDANPKGIVVLSGCDVRVTKDKKLYSFRISHPKTSKVYDLATTLPSRTEEWIEALQAATRFVSNSSMLAPQLSRSESTNSSMDGGSGSGSSRGLRTKGSSSNNLRASLVGLNSADFDVIRLDNNEEHMAALPEQFKSRLEALMAEFVLQARDDALGWKLQTEKLDVKAYVRSASKLGSFKGVGVIQQHPYVVLKLILEISRRHLFDPQLLAKQRLHLYDQHTFIDHLVYKAVFPASPRDFVNITHWRVLRDGSILVIAASVDREDLCPKKEPKIVRAEAIMAGFLLLPSADYTSVTAKYITKADIKSGVPQAMQTKLFIKQAFLIDGIRKALEDDEHESSSTNSSTTYPRVTNSTHFALSVTESEQDDEDEYDDDVSDSGEQDVENQVADNQEGASSSNEYGHPTIPAEYKDLLEKAIARMDAEIDDASAWVFHSEKHGVKAYTKVDGSLTSCKGTGFLPFHPRLILDLATDASERTTVDPQLAFGGSLKRFDAQTCIDYFEYKSPVFVVAGRDFCNLVHWRVLPSGTIVVVGQSIEDHALCPLKEPKVVRGEIHLACWKIVPNASYTGADVTFMAKSDLKGSIPARVAGKAAAEQPFVILRMAEALKKRKNTADIIALGKVVNLGSASASPSVARRVSRSASAASQQASSNGSSSSKSVNFSSSHQNGVTTPAASGKKEPAPETRDAVVNSSAAHQANGHSDHKRKYARSAPSTENTPTILATYAAQFVIGVLALKTVGLPQILHFGVILALLVYFAVQVQLGPCNMSPRRKLMIASFGPPDSGMILGTLEMDVTKTKQYIEAKRRASGDHITITHVVLRAIGAALGDAPSLNGHIVFGNYYPAPTVDISCLVAVDGGKDLGVCRLPEVDKMDLKAICSRLRGDASKLRSGKDKEQDDRNQLLRLLPTYIIRPVVNIIGWLGGAVGIRVQPVGVERYMFGSCMVTSVGMMGLDLAFAPLTPYAQTPMLVTVGAIKDKAVVVDGQVVVRPILMITTTIDHRYVDGSEAARMARSLSKYIEDPSVLEPVL
ncbi:hypothetical protein Gpo141_00001489 [Globisporangium polare]